MQRELGLRSISFEDGVVRLGEVGEGRIEDLGTNPLGQRFGAQLALTRAQR